jgi:nitrogen fixation NifU-like protein
MADLNDLYQEVILDHNRRPRNFHAIPGATQSAEGYNPLCGDRLTLYVQLDGDRISDVAFEGSGCAISKASASLMTEALKGKSVEEARRLFHGFHDLLTANGDPEGLGKLAVFEGVREYPIRIKCATLAWHAVQAALEQKDHPVSTE